MARAAVVAQSLETVVAFSFPYRLPLACATAFPVGDIEHPSRLPRLMSSGEDDFHPRQRNAHSHSRWHFKLRRTTLSTLFY